VALDLSFKVTVGKIGDFQPLCRQYFQKVEVKIMQYSTCSSPIPLVLWGKFHPEILRGSPTAKRQTREGWVKSAVFYLQA